MTLKPFSQNDKRWAGVLLGSSKLSIGQWGCAFIGLINIWRALTGKDITAKRLIEIARNPKNFTDKKHAQGPGLILWDKVCAELGGIKFLRSESGYDRVDISAAIKSKNGAVVLQVKNGRHFSAGWNVLKNDIRIADSWDGILVGAIARYGNITGARYFERV